MPTPTAAEVFTTLVDDLKDRAALGAYYHGYYRGEQVLPIDVSEFRSKFGAVFSEFRANFARPIIDSAEGRLRFTEFGDGKGVAKDALRLWQANRMTSESKWVMTDALVWAETFVIVMKDEDGKPAMWPQAPGHVGVLFDPVNPRRKVAAIKWWVEKVADPENGVLRPQDYVRVNLYFEDRVERYISKSQGELLDPDFTKYVSQGTTKHDVGEVPVFPFRANYDLTEDAGRSDLADAVGYIDAITKTVLDLLVSSEYTAAPQRWATGVEIPLDPKTGEPMESYRSGADRLWTAPNELAKFGQFQGGEMTGYRDALASLVSQVAHISRTPLYAMMEPAGEYPADAALKTSEMSLRQRVADHQEGFTYAWAEAMVALLRLDGITAEVADVLPRWLPVNAPFATRELLEEVKVKVEVAGVPEEQAWRELGYTEDEIDAMKAMREEEAALGLDVAAAGQADAIVAGAPPAGDALGGLTDAALEVGNPTAAPQ